MTTSMVAPVTACAAKTLLTDPEATSVQSPPGRHGKENNAPNGLKVSAPVENARKRKAQVDIKSVKRNGKHTKVTEENSMVDICAAQEKDTPRENRENGTDEPAATRSGHKSNLPNRFKDAAPPKKNMRKTDA
jgi:hypothetical protein